MSEIITVESGDVDEALDQQKAKEVADTLNHHYPGYLWFVGFQGRALVVKLGQIQASQTIIRQHKNYGFVIKHCDAFSASDLVNQAVSAGGEILERAGLRRGAWRGDIPHKLDVT